MSKIANEGLTNAQMAFLNGQYETALNFCKSIMEYDQTSGSVFALAGKVCVASDNPSEAETYFRRAIALSDEKSGELYFDLANSLFGQQKMTEALENYAKAEQLGCSNEVVQKLHYIMGIINQAQGKPKAALLNYDKSGSVQGINADQDDILLKKIQIYVELGDFKSAENCAVQLKLLIPNEFRTYQLLFQLLLQQKKTDEAEKILYEAEKYCDLDRQARIQIVFYQAVIQISKAEQSPLPDIKRYDEAISILRGLTEDSDIQRDVFCDAEVAMAEVYLKLEQIDNAMACATRVLQVANANNTALEEQVDKARYILLECCAYKKEFKKMAEYAVKLKQSKNTFYRHHGYYSEAYATKMQGDSSIETVRKLYEIAIAYFANCMTLNLADFIAVIYRTKAYADMGNYNKADEFCNILPAEAQAPLKNYIQKCREEERNE